MFGTENSGSIGNEISGNETLGRETCGQAIRGRETLGKEMFDKEISGNDKFGTRITKANIFSCPRNSRRAAKVSPRDTNDTTLCVGCEKSVSTPLEVAAPRSSGLATLSRARLLTGSRKNEPIARSAFCVTRVMVKLCLSKKEKPAAPARCEKKNERRMIEVIITPLFITLLYHI